TPGRPLVQVRLAGSEGRPPAGRCPVISPSASGLQAPGGLSALGGPAGRFALVAGRRLASLASLASYSPAPSPAYAPGPPPQGAPAVPPTRLSFTERRHAKTERPPAFLPGVRISLAMQDQYRKLRWMRNIAPKIFWLSIV